MHYIALGAKHGNFQLDYVTPGSLALCGDIQAQTDFNKIYWSHLLRIYCTLLVSLENPDPHHFWK